MASAAQCPQLRAATSSHGASEASSYGKSGAVFPAKKHEQPWRASEASSYGKSGAVSSQSSHEQPWRASRLPIW